MNRAYLKDKWLEIEKSRKDKAFKILRYFSNPAVKLFVAVVENGNRALLLYSDNISSLDRLPVEKENINLSIKEDAVILTLTNPSYYDVFDDLVLSISSTLNREHRIDKHLSLFISKYVEWATFFRNGTSRRLSFEQLMGLYGELTILKQSLLSENNFTHHKILSSWRGPFGGVHDFVFDNHDLEVKTKLCKTATINISSKYQLEAISDKPLKLCVVNLVIDDSQGQALYHLICSIRDVLTSSNSDISTFYRALLIFDVTIESSSEYDNYRFSLDSTDIYDTMTEGFPKLVTANIAVGITSVKYKIDIKSIQPFNIKKT